LFGELEFEVIFVSPRLKLWQILFTWMAFFILILRCFGI